MKCEKHPKYKAILKPTADCQECRNMYFSRIEEEAQKWRQINKAYEDNLYDVEKQKEALYQTVCKLRWPKVKN